MLIELATGLPVYLHFGKYIIYPHLFFETLGYFVAARLYFFLRRRMGDRLLTPIRWAMVAAAVTGAAIGAKVLYWLEDPWLTWQNLHDPAFLLGGKTIVGALLGGLIAVEWMKKSIGLRESTGDLYAIPLAAGIAIGRVGCFLTGLSDNTYGTPTSLPWGVDFGDGVKRHPTQLYEIGFLLLLVPVLYRVLRQVSLPQGLKPQSQNTPNGTTEVVPFPNPQTPALRTADGAPLPESPTTDDRRPMTFLPGDAFKLFMVAYLAFRLICDFIKPYTRVFLGLGGIQWACVLGLIYYAGDVKRWIRSS